MRLAIDHAKGERRLEEFEPDEGFLTRPRVHEEISLHVEDVLEGTMASQAAGCLGRARRRAGLISRPLLDILAHGRCDAAAWLAFDETCGCEVKLPGPEGGRTVTPVHEVKMPEATRVGEPRAVMDAMVSLGPGFYWTGGGTLDLEVEFCETVKAAATGRPLSLLFSHPALDRTPMTVVGFDENGSGGTIVVTDLTSRPLPEWTTPFSELAPDMLWPAMRIA